MCEAGEAVIEEDFEVFVRDAEPRLRRALIGARGIDATADAVAEALAYAFANWSEVRMMDNPVGYLYRVGQSKSRPRKPLRLAQQAGKTGLPPDRRIGNATISRHDWAVPEWPVGGVRRGSAW